MSNESHSHWTLRYAAGAVVLAVTLGACSASSNGSPQPPTDPVPSESAPAVTERSPVTTTTSTAVSSPAATTPTDTTLPRVAQLPDEIPVTVEPAGNAKTSNGN